MSGVTESLSGDLSGIDAGSLAAWLGHGIPVNVVRRLMLLPRFAPRVAELVETRMGALPKALEPGQKAALMMDRWGLQGLMLRAGAIWYSGRIARRINGADVRALVSVIGPELRNIALMHRELAPDADLIDTDLEPEENADELATLGAGIERNGVACVKAWCQKQPEPVALRMELRLPRRPVPSDLHMEKGIAIVETLLWGLAS